MPKELTPEEVIAILESGSFDELIGAVEHGQLECKAAPYQLKSDRQKLELAKDVSSFANADGGVILIGVKTERDPTHFGDEIKEIRPFQQTRMDPDQYLKILSAWIYPNLQQHDVRWLPSIAKKERGVAVIIIPNQPQALRPFLLTKTIDDKDKVVEVVFGYVERRRDRAPPMSVQELHTLLKEGLNYEQLIRGQLEGLRDEVQHLRFLVERAAEEDLAPRPDMVELLGERIEQSLREVNLLNRPVFILAATPVQPVEIKTIFESRDSEVVRLLKDPPIVRRAGFDVYCGTSVPIVRGQLRRAVLPGYKILELWRDGSLIFAVTGDQDFLCWPRRHVEGGPLRVNQIALIEATYLFAELSRQLLDHMLPRPPRIEYRLYLRNMDVDGVPAGLIPGPVGSIAWDIGRDIHRAPDSDREFAVGWDGNTLDASEVAFRLVSEVYTWFGLEHDNIPYTSRIDDHLVIDPDKIGAIGI